FDPIELKLPREETKDLHLFLCDDIYYMDRKKEQIERFQYDFEANGLSTRGLARTGARVPRPTKRKDNEIVADHTPEEYMVGVEAVREGMRQGDYYEVVLRQTFSANYSGSPSALFERIQHASPSPYEFCLQLGDEQLVGASPEMFVRVEGGRAGDRESGEIRKRLVWRGCWNDLNQRRHQHRHADSHHSSEERHRPVRRGRDAAVRFGSGARGRRNAHEGGHALPGITSA